MPNTDIIPKPTPEAPLGSVALFIKVATSQDGYVEGPKSNQTKYGQYTRANFLPWCGSFLCWAANNSGVKIPNVVSTKAGALAFKAAGRWYTSDPQPGDLVFYAWTGKIAMSNIQHVELYVKDLGKGSYQSVAGNLSPSGSQSNGGQVMIKTRTQFGIVGYGRPDYAKSVARPVKAVIVKAPVKDAYPGDTVEFGEVSDNVKFVQRKLKVSDVDGQFGPVTKKAVLHLQATYKPTIGESNGVVGPKTWKVLQGL